MPKPLYGDNGSGMHTHQSLWKDGRNLFYDKGGYALLSETARRDWSRPKVLSREELGDPPVNPRVARGPRLAASAG